MKASRIALPGLVISLLACWLAVPSIAAAQSCSWQAEISRDWVRSPIQMDIHAGYRFFVFESDGTVGLTVRGQYPYAAFLSFAVYDRAMVHSALTDYQIVADQGSLNPFLANNLVNAPNRSYTVTVLPDGKVSHEGLPNPIRMARAHGPNKVTVVLVQRIYLAEPQVKDRFGGVAAPTIEAFDLTTLAPVACPKGHALEGWKGGMGQSPLPRDGKIEFYRPPASTVPFADGSNPMTNHDCTSYLAATVFPDELAVVHLPTVPTFFDNTNTSGSTRFENMDVRYISMGSYGATPMGVRENENVAGPDIKRLHDGSATFVAVPIRLLLSDTEEARQVKKAADKLGYNVMPLAEYGPLFPWVTDGIQIYPFLILRNKVPAPGFVGKIENVPCYQGPTFADASEKYAASPENMDKYAPVGIECSVDAFLHGGCGQNFPYSRR